MPVLSWWTSRPEPTDRPRRCTSTSSGGTRSQGRRWGLEPVRIAVHDLDTNGGTRQPVPLGERTRGAFRERLEEWADGIRAGRFESAEVREEVWPGWDFGPFCQNGAEVPLL